MEKREIRFDGWQVDFASGEISKDGRTFHFVMSQFGPYNAYVMKAVLTPR